MYVSHIHVWVCYIYSQNYLMGTSIYSIFLLDTYFAMLERLRIPNSSAYDGKIILWRNFFSRNMGSVNYPFFTIISYTPLLQRCNACTISIYTLNISLKKLFVFNSEQNK